MTEIFPEKLVKIEWSIAEELRITLEDLRDGNRQKEFVTARQLVWAIAYEKLDYSLTRLARLYHKDHTTILHGIRQKLKTEAYEAALRSIEVRYPGLLGGVDSEGITPAQSVKK